MSPQMNADERRCYVSDSESFHDAGMAVQVHDADIVVTTNKSPIRVHPRSSVDIVNLISATPGVDG